MIANRSMPASVVIPELPYPDLTSAVEWLGAVFGVVERLRIGNHRAQLMVGGGDLVAVQAPSTPRDRSASGDAPAGGHSVMVRIEDVDAHYEHARQQGARIVSVPTEYPFGERQYTAEDLRGHRWTFSQSIADVDPASWGAVVRTPERR